MDDELKKALKDGLMILAIAIAGYMVAFHLTSCHSLKTVKHEIRDSVKADSLVTTKVNQSDSKKDSLNTSVNTSTSTVTTDVLIDSAIGFEGKKLGFTIEKGVHLDTFLEDGILQVHIYTDGDGNNKVDVDLDSFTIVVQRLRRTNTKEVQKSDSISTRYTALEHKYDSLAEVKEKVIISHSETTIKEKREGAFSRAFRYAKNLFAIIGLIWLVVFIVKRFVK